MSFFGPSLDSDVLRDLATPGTPCSYFLIKENSRKCKTSVLQSEQSKESSYTLPTAFSGAERIMLGLISL